MKSYLINSLVSVFIIICFACKTSSTNAINKKEIAEKYSDTVSIKSDITEYEIVIIEPGFNYWLNSVAQPKGFYTKNFLESRNRLFVLEWNLRVNQPQLYDPNLYELRIDYDPKIDYGYDLNWELYNYFIYFQLTYKQKLTAFIPRI